MIAYLHLGGPHGWIKVAGSVAVVYIADSGHAPYGSRTAEFIERRALPIAQCLQSAGAEIIVLACNIATAVAVRSPRPPWRTVAP